MPAPYPPWKYYPSWQPRPDWVPGVVGAVGDLREQIDSAQYIASTFQNGPVVHAKLKPGLEAQGFIVEGPGDRGNVTGLRRAVLHGEGASMDLATPAFWGIPLAG
jgi:hypothetical protein